MQRAADYLKGNRYPGRGILVGKSADGRDLILAYFIMGRSENSRNRVLVVEDGVLYTRAFDESKVADPSLIIYPAMRRIGDRIVLTNGDQTDTIAQALASGVDFFSALETRTYEPDAPNYTPRISALVTLKEKDFDSAFSILRREAEGEGCERGRFEYRLEAGVCRLIHTYRSDGNPLPSFEGEPKALAVEGAIGEWSAALWDALDEENKIALFACSIDLATGKEETMIFNKHGKE